MKELLQKMLALGWGVMAITKETADRLVDELVNKGQMGREEARALVNQLSERSKKERQELQQTMRQEMAGLLSELNLPSSDDIARLEEKIDRLLQLGRE